MEDNLSRRATMSWDISKKDGKWSDQRKSTVDKGRTADIFFSEGRPDGRRVSRIPYCIYYSGPVGDFSPSNLKGFDHLQNPTLNKGFQFSLEERQLLGLHGLLPPCIRNTAVELEYCYSNLQRCVTNLDKFCFLMSLRGRNHVLFHQFVHSNLQLTLPLLYTPTCIDVVQNCGVIYRSVWGIFITIYDRGHVKDILRNWPEIDIRVVCVTDGEDVLGLGDQGAHAMGAIVSKLVTCSILGGIKPHQILPVVLDVGTDNQALIDDPLYLGIRCKRVQGLKYDDLINEFMRSIVLRYGNFVFIMFEGIGKSNIPNLWNHFTLEYTIYMDETLGYAAAGMAALLASTRVTRKSIKEYTFLFFGTGEVSANLADMCVRAMEEAGTGTQAARNRIFLFDTDSQVTVQWAEWVVPTHNRSNTKTPEQGSSFGEAVTYIKPNVVVGVAGQAGAFTDEVLQELERCHVTPIILILSTEHIRMECKPEDAYRITKGRCYYASGCFSPPVRYQGQMFHPAYVGPACVFPGITLGVISGKVARVTVDMMFNVAQEIAQMVTNEDLERGSLLPPVDMLPQCAEQVALRVLKTACMQGLSQVVPEPTVDKDYIRSHMFDPNPITTLVPTYEWPKVIQ